MKSWCAPIRFEIGCRDAGGAGTKRPAATDDARADEGGPRPAAKKQIHGTFFFPKLSVIGGGWPEYGIRRREPI